jgi:hypothetical protein
MHLIALSEIWGEAQITHLHPKWISSQFFIFNALYPSPSILISLKKQIWRTKDIRALQISQARIKKGSLWIVQGFPVPFHRFQLNLIRGDSLLYHPHRWDEAKSVPERSFDQHSPAQQKMKFLNSPPRF